MKIGELFAAVKSTKQRGNFLARCSRAKKEEEFYLEREKRFQDDLLGVTGRVDELRKKVKTWYDTNETKILPSPLTSRHPVEHSVEPSPQ